VAKKQLLVSFPVLDLGGTRSGAELCLLPLKQPGPKSRVPALHGRGGKDVWASFAKQERITLTERKSILRCPRGTANSKTELQLQLNFKLR